MTLDGNGAEQIAAALTADKILTPMFYWRGKGIKRAGKVSDREPHRWNSHRRFMTPLLAVGSFIK